MRRIINRRGLAVLAIAALAACDSSPTAAPVNAGGHELARQVAALGYRGDMIEDMGEYVIVEGDIRLSKAQLRSVPLAAPGDPVQPRFQYRTNNLVGSPKVHDIRVNLAGLAAEPDWADAARTAIGLWSGVPDSYVRMVEAAPGAPADIAFVLACMHPNVAAAADPPSGGNPGGTVTVNSAACRGFAQNDQQRLHNMVHEIGHTLGFRHTNWNSVDCVNAWGQFVSCNGNTGPNGAHHIWGTPTSGNDPGSVMNGATALNAWAGFSANDLLATRRLYPLPSVTGASSIDFGGQVRLTWNPVAGALSYDVQRVEERTEDDFYANTVTTTVTEFGWLGPVSGSPFDTGSPWTGVTHCVWSMTWQTSDVSTYFYRIVANFPTGSSASYVSVYANDATC